MKLQRYALLLCTGALLEGNLACLQGQDAGSTASPNQQTQTTPAINFQVLSQTKVDLGNHSVIYNFVATPVLPAPTPPPTTSLSPADLAWFNARSQKVWKRITLIATVYDHQITDLQYSDGTQTCRAFSDIDFSYFPPTGFIETADTVYDYVLFVSSGTSAALSQANPNWSADTAQTFQDTLNWVTQASQQLPNLSLSPNSQSGFLVAANSAPDNGVAAAALTAIHAYYDANHVQVIAAYQQRVADAATAQQYAKDHPQIPQDTVINFWPVQSTNYPAMPQGGQQ